MDSKRTTVLYPVNDGGLNFVKSRDMVGFGFYQQTFDAGLTS